MPSHHFTEENQHHMSQLTNVSLTQQLNGILFQMTSRRTQYEPTLTPTDWHSSSTVFKMINQIWVEHTKYQYRFNKLDTQFPLCKLSYLLIGRSNVHRDHNTSPLREFNSSPPREVQISFRCQFSRTQIQQIASYGLHHQMWLRLCGYLRTLPKGSSHP